MNKETLKNAFQLFEEEGIIVLSKSRDSKIPTMVKLVPEWTPGRAEQAGGIVPQGKLWKFAETIAQSRREGSVTVAILCLSDRSTHILQQEPPGWCHSQQSGFGARR